MKNLEKTFLFVGILFLSLSITSCDNDDDNGIVVDPDPEHTGTIVVEDQIVSQNQVQVDEVTVSTDAWLVTRHNDDVGEIIADPILIEEGTRSDITIQLNDMEPGNELQDNDVIVLLLHAENGDGSFDPVTDELILNASGEPAAASIVVTLDDPIPAE